MCSPQVSGGMQDSQVRALLGRHDAALQKQSALIRLSKAMSTAVPSGALDSTPSVHDTPDRTVPVDIDVLQTPVFVAGEGTGANNSTGKMHVVGKVRPLNRDEVRAGCSISVERLPDCKTLKFNSTRAGFTVSQRFELDRVFWSVDPSAPDYCSEDTFFQDVGVGMVTHAFKGYHTALLLYGQTDAGKTYTLTNLCPQLCKALFARAYEREELGDHVDIGCTMYEVYNEHVFDLLGQSHSSANQGKNVGLKVRTADQGHSYHIEGVTVVRSVKNAGELTRIIQVGEANRWKGWTTQNQRSSRSHVVIELELAQTNSTPVAWTHVQGDSQVVSKRSKLTLVDLAGTEAFFTSNDRPGTPRARETASINKSLFMLLQCVRKLSTGATPDYRSSTLTKLLKPCLTGNTKTTLCVALSPADEDTEETISTLRFAQSARSIVEYARINRLAEPPSSVMYEALKVENEKLRRALEGARRLNFSSPAERQSARRRPPMASSTPQPVPKVEPWDGRLHRTPRSGFP